uniref:Reverse transcriptase/retrotransposon-derived protein RNase H-like domain-containing protein n=1 Tax=Nicotiana tabacum TaxID=4097 RepID=A0A1S4D424_TOBAC
MELQSQRVDTLPKEIQAAKCLGDYQVEARKDRPQQPVRGGYKGGQPNTGGPSRRCRHCGRPHWNNECPHTQMNAHQAFEDGTDDDADDADQTEPVGAFNAIVGSISKPLTGTSTGIHMGATHNYLASTQVERLGLVVEKGKGRVKAINSPPQPVDRIAKEVPVKLGPYEEKFNLRVVIIDDFELIVGLKFLRQTNTMPAPYADLLLMMGEYGAKPCIIPCIPMKMATENISALQLKKGLKRHEPMFLATLCLEDIERSSGPIHAPMKELLLEFEDIMPQDMPKRLPPRRTVDHEIELVPGEKPPARAPNTIQTLEEHLEHLRKVLARLREHELYAKLSKCSFAQKQIDFLEHVMEEGRIKMDQQKIQAITEWPPLEDIHALRSFLGLCNFYRCFVKSYSLVAVPLTELLKKVTPWDWGPKRAEAFDALKMAMSSSPVLALPDLAKPFEVQTDASIYALGGVLPQEGHPVAYESRKLKDAERRYAAHEKELLAVINCLHLWRHYLLGKTRQFYTEDSFLKVKGNRLYVPKGGDLEGLFWRNATILCGPVIPKDKPDRLTQAGLLEPLAVPKRPWESISLDFIIGLPK